MENEEMVGVSKQIPEPTRQLPPDASRVYLFSLVLLSIH